MTVVVLNAETLAISEHSGSPIDTFAASGMLYRIEASRVTVQQPGEIDFAPLIRIGRLSPIGGQEFNIAKVTLGAYGASGFTVAAATEEQGASGVVGPFEVNLGSHLDQHEVILGTGVAARSYQFTLGLTNNCGVRTFDVYTNPVRHRRG